MATFVRPCAGVPSSCFVSRYSTRLYGAPRDWRAGTRWENSEIRASVISGSVAVCESKS